MGKVRFTRRMAASAAVVAALAGGASAAALATGQSSSKSFQACLGRKHRTLYNVRFNPASPVTCHRGDKRVSWNQAGPAGTPGEPGTAGQPGTPGQAGQPGQPGADGNTILNGSGAPATGLGKVGDFYLDTAADAIYGPKNASGWGGPTGLVGRKGDPGAPGAKGDPGAPGMSGFQTVTGQTGTVPAGNIGAIDTPCPSGMTAISGGYKIPYTATVLEDHPTSGNPGSWEIAAAFPTNPGTITTYVQCATVQ